jgi:predicted AAA+ superfamily ATPase
MNTVLREEIINNLNKLPVELQKKVKDFVDALISTIPKGTSGKSLAKYAGTLSNKDAQEFIDAIEDGCERINEDDW